MIDSNYFRQLSLVPPPASEFSKFTRKGDRAFYRDDSLDYSPTLFCRRAPDAKYYLGIQASLPKLLYGHNVKMLDESALNDALKILQEFATTRFGIFFDVYKTNLNTGQK